MEENASSYITRAGRMIKKRSRFSTTPLQTTIFKRAKLTRLIINTAMEGEN